MKIQVYYISKSFMLDIIKHLFFVISFIQIGSLLKLLK